MQLGIPLLVVTSVRRARPCHRNAHADPRRDNASLIRQGWGEVLNRNDHHTLDAKDHDGSMSHLGHQRT